MYSWNELSYTVKRLSKISLVFLGFHLWSFNRIVCIEIQTYCLSSGPHTTFTYLSYNFATCDLGGKTEKIVKVSIKWILLLSFLKSYCIGNHVVYEIFQDIPCYGSVVLCQGYKNIINVWYVDYIWISIIIVQGKCVVSTPTNSIV